MATTKIKVTTLGFLVTILSSGVCFAQQAQLGADEYGERCAACHGMSGAGDGPIASMMTTSPPDLTLLSRSNNGAFPFSEVYQSINGQMEVAAHGTSDMPLWGDYFADQAIKEGHESRYGSAEVARQVVQGRILALVYYLQSIQK